MNKNTVHNYFTTVNYVARPDNIGLQAKMFGKSSIFNPTIISFEKTSSYWLDQFFLAFHWSPSIGKPRMTPGSSVKTTESYEVCRLIIRDLSIGFHLDSTFTGMDPNRRA